MVSQDLSPRLKAFAEREFLGERLIWAEKPDQRIKGYLSFGIGIFAIPWTAFALLWESMVAGPLRQKFNPRRRLTDLRHNPMKA